MDWSSSKGPSWDWPEFDQQQSFPSSSNDDVDLKLGSVIITSRTQLGSSSSVSNLPSKRPKAAANSSTTTTQATAYYCLVDDCTSDLSNCRDYHRRHKVCEVHSKTPEVTIQGRKQRFCQQCSRFHAPDEFDEGKRSCRKRLDGHNRRRRKPQPDTHLQQGTYLPNFPGAGILSFSNRPCLNSWSGSVNKLEDHHNTQPHLDLLKQTDYSSSRYREGKLLTFSQGEHQTNQHAPPQDADHKVFYNGLTNNQSPDSDCVLSLLSRPLLPMHTTPTEISFGNVIPMRPRTSSGDPNNHFSMLQTSVPNPDVNFHSMFQTGADVPNEPQTLPFYWE